MLGFIDFAGSGVVHMVGGSAGLAATLIIKARHGRFEEEVKVEDGELPKPRTSKQLNFKPNYVPFIALGTLLLWFSWYGFNCGSTVNVVSTDNVDSSTLVGLIGINTTIAAAAGGMTSFIAFFFINKETNESYSVTALCNGILAGLVGVTASCANITSWAAFIIGVFSGLIYLGYSYLWIHLKIDDP